MFRRRGRGKRVESSRPSRANAFGHLGRLLTPHLSLATLLMGGAATLGALTIGWALSNRVLAQTTEAPLQITKTADAVEVSAGDAIGFHVGVSNTAPSPGVGTIVIENRIFPHWVHNAQFDFTTSMPRGSFTLFSQDESTSPQLFPDTYTVHLDQIPAHFELVDITCSDGSPGVVSSGTATIDLAANETVRCVFTSRQETRGTIVIENRISPHWVHNAQFDFTTSMPRGSFTLFSQDESTSPQLFPDTYTVHLDQIPAHFELVDITCSDGSPGVVSSGTATIDLAANESVRCVFTSRQETRGTIVIENRIPPTGFTTRSSTSRRACRGGPSRSSVRMRAPPHNCSPTPTRSISTRYPRTSSSSTSPVATARQGSSPLAPPPSTSLRTSPCAACSPAGSGALDDGLGTVIIEKQFAPDDVFDFGDLAHFTSPDLPQCASGPFNLAAGAQLPCGYDVPPGIYHVTEQEPTGAGDHFVTLSCDDTNSSWDEATRTATIHLEEDETVRCVFTDTARRGTVIIEKQYAPDDVFEFGDLAHFTSPDFPQCQLGLFNFAAGTQQVCGDDVRPGTYHITEQEPSGAGDHFVTLSCDDTNSSWDEATRTATIHLEEDKTVRCVFTDTARRGTVIIEKQAVPGSDLGDFAHITSPDLPQCQLGVFEFSAGTQRISAAMTCVPGTYHVTEQEPTGAGDHFVMLSCDDKNSTWDEEATRTATIHLEEDETVRCVFVNAGQSATTAHNVTLTDELPSGPDIHWSMDPVVAGCSISGSTLTCDLGDLAAAESVEVHVTSPTTTQSCGTYDNTASAVADNIPQVRASASVTVTCPTGSLEVAKTLNTGGSNFDTTTKFDINYDCGGGVSGMVLLAGGSSTTVNGIPTGSVCTVTEPSQPAAPTGYSWTVTITGSPTAAIMKNNTESVEVDNTLTRDRLARARQTPQRRPGRLHRPVHDPLGLRSVR